MSCHEHLNTTVVSQRLTLFAIFDLTLKQPFFCFLFTPGMVNAMHL